MVSILERFAKDPILSKCRPESLSRLLIYVEEFSVDAGTYLYRAGEPADNFYLATVSEVRLETPSGVPLPWTEGGLGIESATDSAVYLTSAVAIAPTTVVRIPREHLIPILASRSGLIGDLTLKLLSYITTHPLLKHLPKRDKPLSQPKKQSTGSWMQLTGWLLTILLPLLILWATQRVDMDHNAGMFLAILTATVVMWIFPIVDDYLPCIFAVMAILLSGLAPSAIVLSGFASDGFLMAMSILALSTVITASGLGYRAMLLLLRALPNRKFWHNCTFSLVGVILTPLIPSANGRVALITPLYQDLTQNLKLRRAQLVSTQLAVSAFGGATLLSSTFISSKSVNFAIFSLLPIQTQGRFEGLGWIIAAGASAIFLMILQAVTTALVFRSDEHPELSKERVADQLRLLGKTQPREWAAIIGIVVLIAGMATPSLHGIQAPWLGLTVLYGLLLFGALSKAELREKTDWPFLLYLVGLTCLVETFNHLGLNAKLASSIPWLGILMRDHLYLFVLSLFAIICVVRFAVPISATVVIFASLLIPLADIYGVNPWVIGFIILVLGEIWFLPYQCSYYLQIQVVNQPQPFYQEKHFLIHNALMSVARLAAVYLSIPYWKMMGIL